MKTALITGITGQDGAYLAELLLAKGYRVHGVKRRSSLINTDRVDHLYQDPHEKDLRFTLHYGDMTDSTNLIRIVQETQPDEIYNLAAMSFTPREIAAEIQKPIPEFTISYQPDFRQTIADSWPASIDDSRAREDWNWHREFNLESMTVDMLKNLSSTEPKNYHV